MDAANPFILEITCAGTIIDAFFFVRMRLFLLDSLTNPHLTFTAQLHQFGRKNAAQDLLSIPSMLNSFIVIAQQPMPIHTTTKLVFTTVRMESLSKLLSAINKACSVTNFLFSKIKYSSEHFKQFKFGD